MAKGKSNSLEDEVVTNCITRYSYGFKSELPFEDHKHLREDRIWCPYRCRFDATNQMLWYLKKVRCLRIPIIQRSFKFTEAVIDKTLQGTNVRKSDPVAHDWYQYLDTKQELAEIRMKVYYCALDTPPSRGTEGNKSISSSFGFLNR